MYSTNLVSTPVGCTSFGNGAPFSLELRNHTPSVVLNQRVECGLCKCSICLWVLQLAHQWWQEILTTPRLARITGWNLCFRGGAQEIVGISKPSEASGSTDEPGLDWIALWVHRLRPWGGTFSSSDEGNDEKLTNWVFFKYAGPCNCSYKNNPILTVMHKLQTTKLTFLSSLKNVSRNFMATTIQSYIAD